MDCRKYSITLAYPETANFRPIVYEIDNEKDKEIKCKMQPEFQPMEDGLVKATWMMANVSEGQAFRLKW